MLEFILAIIVFACLINVLVLKREIIDIQRDIERIELERIRVEIPECEGTTE